MFDELWRRVKATVLGLACDRCGKRGVAFVIDAHPAGKKVDGRRGLVIRTMTVAHCAVLCADCRRKPAQGSAVPR